jgi:hypothetical protein
MKSGLSSALPEMKSRSLEGVFWKSQSRASTQQSAVPRYLGTFDNKMFSLDLNSLHANDPCDTILMSHRESLLYLGTPVALPASSGRSPSCIAYDENQGTFSTPSHVPYRVAF